MEYNTQKRIHELESEVEILNKIIDDMNKHIDALILGVGTIIESRDVNTGQHVFRTSKCVEVFVKELLKHDEIGVDETLGANIIKAAPLHDIGKIAIKDEILQKKGRFSDEEYEIMKKHSAEGRKMIYMALSDLPDEKFIHIAMNIAGFHHEKWDGTGYPNGLAKEKIPLEARIMAFADVFDALVSKRCYKDNYSYDKAFSIISDSLGSHFDPVLGKVFLSIRSDLERLYDRLLQDDNILAITSNVL